MKRRYYCMACRCDELELAVETGHEREPLYVCFECQQLFYFMGDGLPRPRELALSELYQRPLGRSR
jgi:hypothetical protein